MHCVVTKVYLAVILLAPATLSQGFSQQCLDKLAHHGFQLQPAAGAGSAELIPDDRLKPGWADGKIRHWKGKYEGIEMSGGVSVHRIRLFPRGIHADAVNKEKMTAEAMQGCSAYVLGYALAVIVHELHHAESLCGEADGDDCIHMSIHISTAQKTCQKAIDVKICLEDPECDPASIDPSFDSKEDLEDMLEGLCDRHAEMKERFNSEENAMQAKACACDGSYSPPRGCPPIPAPPGGCDAPNLSGYPIPSCTACAR